MTRRELALRVAFESNIPTAVAERAVLLVLNSIIESLESTGGIELRNFGVFKVVIRRRLQARNPKTGAVVVVPPRPHVRFWAGKEMVARLLGSKIAAPAARGATIESPI